MATDENSSFDDDHSPLTADELNDPGLQAGLKALLAGFQPILDADAARAKDPEALKKETLATPISCEEEVALANRLFEPMATPEVTLALMPEEARELLGPPATWRWCLLHIRCCFIFGWLLCRRPRHFRAFIYYLYRYWRCVREVIGRPVSNPPTREERDDLATLVKIAANAYKPYLGEESAAVDFSAGLPDEVISGALDCFDVSPSGAQLFERLLTPEAAMALLGKEAFAAHGQEQFFWFCRCWCLCAIRYGCCLAGAKTYIDRLRCLAFYRRCLRRCFQPLTCRIDKPQGCVAEEISTVLGAMVVHVYGTAAGSGFSHYVLEWSTDDITYHATNFNYPPIPPGGGVQGNAPVFGGLLADLDTGLIDPGVVFLQLTVFAVTGATCVFKTKFSLSKQDIRILGVDNYATLNTSWVDPAAQFIENVPALCTRPASVSEVSFGDCLSIQGAAFVGGCEERRVKQYTLDYKPGFETDCTSGGWTNFWAVVYDTPVKQRYINRRTDFSTLTSVWGPDCMVTPPGPPPCFSPPWRSVPDALLYASCWNSHVASCQLSGLFTLRLIVEATDGSTYCDTQRVWIDNKQPCAMIRIDAVPKCADLFISQFALPPDCSVPWSLPVSGIAYDEYIDPLAPLTRPNDNFDYYIVKVTRQGGPTVQIPILGPGGTCFYGTSRVGDPDTATANCKPCNPFNPAPGALFGTLALFDLRAVDAICDSSVTAYPVPAGFALERGECCVYTFDLWVYDRTIRNTGANWAHDSWPVKICNDLPKP